MIVCVDVQSLVIINKYPGEIPTQEAWGGSVGDPAQTLHMVVPPELDPECVTVVRADDGTATLADDPAKVSQKLEASWNSLRAQRNALLAASDWVALADAHVSQDRKDAWFAYRQELRDLPDLITDPTSVTWPLKPGEIPPTPVTGSRFDAILGQI